MGPHALWLRFVPWRQGVSGTQRTCSSSLGCSALAVVGRVVCHVAGHQPHCHQAAFLLHQHFPFTSHPTGTCQCHRQLQPKEPLLNLATARVVSECSWGHARVTLKFLSPAWSLSLSFLLRFYVYSLTHLPGSQHVPHTCPPPTPPSHSPVTHNYSSSVLINGKKLLYSSEGEGVTSQRFFFIIAVIYVTTGQRSKAKQLLSTAPSSQGRETLPWEAKTSRNLPFEMDSSSSRPRHHRMFAWLPKVLTAHRWAQRQALSPECI